MWIPENRTTAIAVWAGTVAVVALCSALLGASLAVGSGVFLLLVCLVPPAVMLMVWHGAPTPTVSEILHADDRQTDV